jgi:TPR repeat protein
MKIITLILYILLTTNTYAAATDAQREEFINDCENNNSVACFNMGLMYSNGDGVTKDDTKALEFYTKACDRNYAKACSNAALLYEESPTLQTDMKKAFKLYNKACGGDDAYACHNVALHYSNKEGFEKVAITLYDKACSGGYAESCIYLGRLYRDSRKVAPNYALAKEKFDIACEANNYLGCKELRILQELERAGYSKH